MPVTTSEMLSVIAQWAASVYPHQPSHKVCIYFHGMAEPVCLPLVPGVPGAQAEASVDEKGKGLSPVVLDILKVLREVGAPMTCMRLMEEFARRGLEWSKRSVDSYLAEMVRDGTLENPEAARPRGYRLPQNA